MEISGQVNEQGQPLRVGLIKRRDIQSVFPRGSAAHRYGISNWVNYLEATKPYHREYRMHEPQVLGSKPDTDYKGITFFPLDMAVAICLAGLNSTTNGKLPPVSVRFRPYIMKKPLWSSPQETLSSWRINGDRAENE